MKLTFAEWLSEREANARQIAASKHGIDKAGWMEDAEYFKQAAALAASPVTPAPEAPIAWWNGIRKTGDGFRDMDQPSFTEQEDTNHDIPVFAGFNPCHASAPEALSDPTPSDLTDPMFESIWQAIKGWDLSRDGGPASYAGANGTDVMTILQAVRAALTALAAPTPGAPEADKPLPEPAGFVRLIGGGQSPIYTADQMRGYAADVLRHEYRKGFIDGQIDMRAAALAAPSTPAKDSAK